MLLWKLFPGTVWSKSISFLFLGVPCPCHGIAISSQNAVVSGIIGFGPGNNGNSAKASEGKRKDSVNSCNWVWLKKKSLMVLCLLNSYSCSYTLILPLSVCIFCQLLPLCLYGRHSSLQSRIQEIGWILTFFLYFFYVLPLVSKAEMLPEVSTPQWGRSPYITGVPLQLPTSTTTRPRCDWT